MTARCSAYTGSFQATAWKWGTGAEPGSAGVMRRNVAEFGKVGAARICLDRALESRGVQVVEVYRRVPWRLWLRRDLCLSETKLLESARPHNS